MPWVSDCNASSDAGRTRCVRGSAGYPLDRFAVARGFAPTLRRYAFSLHPTDSSQCAVVARVEAQRAETRGTA